MNWYLVYSGGLHALAVLCIILLMAPGAKKPGATYTIDFIGTGKVQAVTVPPKAAPAAKPAAAPVQTPVSQPKEAAKPAQKAYVSKQEISTKKDPKKKPAAAATPVAPAEPLAAPSILEDDEQESASSAQEGEFNGGNITTDFANFPYPWYITQVRNSLWVEWEKRRPAGNVLSALISFAIVRDGSIKKIKIERSSEDDTFDFAASSAVINAGPFAPLPMYYEKDELTISVEFRQEN